MEKTFYQVVPKRLMKMLGLSLFAVLWWAALAFYVRSNSTLLLLAQIGFGISGLLLLYAILYAKGCANQCCA